VEIGDAIRNKVTSFAAGGNRGTGFNREVGAVGNGERTTSETVVVGEDDAKFARRMGGR